MAELEPKDTKQQEPYTPASFEKRAAAWMGVAYVLMLMGIFWFTLFSHGGDLPGTFPLFLVPAAVTLAVVVVRRLRLGTAFGGVPGGALALVCCAAAAAFGLALGVPALLAALAG